MSDKTYTADQVAKEVLSKYHDLAKGLFSDQKAMCMPEKAQDTKESVFREIQWALDEIKRLRELSWTVESEVPSAKEMFEKEFEKAKDKVATLVRRHKALKKSAEGNEIEELVVKTLTIADEIWKAEKEVKNAQGVVTPKKKDVEKCGQMTVQKDENNKLKDFLDKKKAKKTNKMEKMLGMSNSTTAPGANSSEAPKPALAAQIGAKK